MVALRAVGGLVHREGLEEARNLAASKLAVDREAQVVGCRFGHLFARLLSELPLFASPLCELLLSEKLEKPLFGRQHVGQIPYVDLFGPWIVPVPFRVPCPFLALTRALYVPSHARVFPFLSHAVWPPPFLVCLSRRMYRQDSAVHQMLVWRRTILVL